MAVNMTKKIKYINSKKAPQAIGLYSQAIKIEKFVFCSGQIALDPKNDELVGKNIEEQTTQVLKNLREVLKASGSSIEEVIKTTVYLKNIKDFTDFNKTYEKFFDKNKPARNTVEVSNLPRNALVEIDAIGLIS